MANTTDNWQKIGQSSTSIKSNTNRAVVSTRKPKTENIIFIGSEFDYDSFWLKNMFIASAYPFIKDRKKFRACDTVTIAYVDYGYTHLEKLAIEGLGEEVSFPCDIRFVPIYMQSQVIDIFNEQRETYKIQDLAFFCHGLNSVISLNYYSSPPINLTTSQINSLNPNIFISNGTAYSYACRTGVSKSDEEFSNLSSAKPDLSFAQKFSTHNNIKFHAFYKRSFYRNILFTLDESPYLSKDLRAKRKSNGDLGSFNLLTKHEALKHVGLGHTIVIKAPVRIPNFFDLIPMGNVGEGVEDYSLWRKGGGMNLPSTAETPLGLPKGIHIFQPRK